MKIPFKPEVIFTNSTTEVSRVKVKNGWIVSTVVNGRNGFALTSTFVLDSDWSWEIENV